MLKSHPVISIRLEEDFLGEIEDFRIKQRTRYGIPSRTDVLKFLLREGLTRMKALESGDVTATPTT